LRPYCINCTRCHFSFHPPCWSSSLDVRLNSSSRDQEKSIQSERSDFGSSWLWYLILVACGLIRQMVPQKDHPSSWILSEWVRPLTIPHKLLRLIGYLSTAYVPSKLHVLSLDLIIIILEMVLTTIAYETSLASATSSTADISDTLMYIPQSPGPQSSSSSAKVDNTSTTNLPYVLDLRLGTLIKRLRAPAPLLPRTTGQDELLPLPNTVPAELRESLRMLLRTRAEIRARAEQTAQERPGDGRPRRVPGAMDADDNE
jgi:hypothetical protein